METESPTPLLKTPLYDKHLKLGAKMLPFGGWIMPIQYEGILAEHAHTRNSAAVFDICHMGEFMLEADAKNSGLDHIVTQDITDMPQGSCRYGFMLDANAGVIDDLVVYRLGESSWMLVVNAATTLKDEEHLRKNLKAGSKLTNVSSSTAKLDLQGPLSLKVINDVMGIDAGRLQYYTFGKFTFLGQDVIISRTGYTGELGFEIYLSNNAALKLWDSLLGDARVKPAGLGCRDTLRLEMGYPLYGQDLDQAHNPLEAGMAKFIDLSKDFIGKAELTEAKKYGLTNHLIFFASDSRRSPRHGFGIYYQGKEVGKVTSGSFSPSLSLGIGMGYVNTRLEEGRDIAIREGSTEIPAKIVRKPFYKKGSVRS
jgi:aminomethyltransferase